MPFTPTLGYIDTTPSRSAAAAAAATAATTTSPLVAAAAAAAAAVMRTSTGSVHSPPLRRAAGQSLLANVNELHAAYELARAKNRKLGVGEQQLVEARGEVEVGPLRA